MNKLKDIFYDKNDILVALLILAIAALVILWRVDVILAYPETLVSGVAEGGSTSGMNSTVSGGGIASGTVSGSGIESGAVSGAAVTSPSGVGAGEGTGAPETEICGIYVNYGDSLDTVAQNCVTAGLIGSTDEFMSAVNALGAAQSIKAGQHHIPMGVTPEELVQYLMKNGL